MTATTKFKARAAILDCLRPVAGLSGVVIDYNHVDNPPESITLGPTIQDDDTDIRAMAHTPVKHTETYTVRLVLFVGSKSTMADNEARADILLEHVMSTLADNYELGIASDGFQWARVSRVEILSGHVADEGPMCRVDLSVECKGRI